MSRVFQDDYASGYDALYREKDYGAECDVVESALAIEPGMALRLLDIGCGTGGHAIELARRGHRVTGVDLSEDMLGHARRKGAASSLEPRLEFVQGDARSFRLPHPPFDAAIMMFAVLGYITENEGLLSALTTVRAHLKPGAHFCCDFWWGPAVLTDRPGERVRTVPTGRGELLRATRTSLDTLHDVAEVHFDMFRFDAELPAVRNRETHRMRYFFGPELTLMCRLAGFEIERLGQFPGLGEAPTDRSWNAMLVARAV
jgi:SAM-dependent methyltransferase